MTVTTHMSQEQRQEHQNFINSIKSPAKLRTYTYSLKYFMAYCKTLNSQVSIAKHEESNCLENKLINKKQSYNNKTQ